jgi:hypothetical protein
MTGVPVPGMRRIEEVDVEGDVAAVIADDAVDLGQRLLDADSEEPVGVDHVEPMGDVRGAHADLHRPFRAR